MKRIATLILVTISFSSAVAAGVRVRGAVSVAVPLLEAAKVLKAEQGIDVQLTVNGGSPAGIDGLGGGTIDLAMSTKPVSIQEKNSYPRTVFTEFPIGMQVIAMAVPRDVWEGGVQALSQEEIQKIYEGKILNWKDLGGPDRKLTVFLFEPGRGYWEMLVQWLYGEIRKAPERPYTVVGSVDQMRANLEFTPGSIGIMPLTNIDSRSLYPLGIKMKGAEVLNPTIENLVSEKYPLCRRLLLVSNGQPILQSKIVVDFILSQRGQAIVKKVGVMPLAELHPQD